MFKIIVADDEIIFREYLRTLIDWEHYGFEICCEARNGIEALEMIKEHKPDIALIDINMPFLDGLSLVEKINESGDNLSIILITGHSEFEYARKAVKLNVVDYILKPFDKEELVMTLLKIRGRLQTQLDKRNEEKGNLDLMKERFLNILISGELTAGEEETRQQLRRFGADIVLEHNLVASIEIDNMYSLWSDASEISLWKFAVMNILNEIMGYGSRHTAFKGPEGRIVSVVELDENTGEAGCLERYRRVCELVKRYLDFTITIGVANPVKGVKAVRKAYLESLVALQNKVVTVNAKVIPISSIATEGMSIGYFPSEINEKLLIALRTNDSTEVALLLENIFKFIKEKRLSLEYVYIVVMGLVSLCFSYIYEIGKNVDQIFDRDFSPYTEIKSKGSLDSLYQWSRLLFQTVLDLWDEGRLKKSKIMADNVREYIDANYHDSSLSVEGIANVIYMNSSYLRKIFKKELNMSVNDYIVDVRLQKARELIGSGNIKLSGISERVGYNDAGYFSKSFKKKFGISPSEYENMKSR